MNVYNTLDFPDMPGGSSVALGLFDGLHLGHMAVIKKTIASAKQGNLVPVVFTFTTSKSAPAAKTDMVCLLSHIMRDEILGRLGVGAVICPEFERFCHLTTEQFVRDVLIYRLKATQLVCGEDFRFGQGAAGDVDTLYTLGSRAGIGVSVVPPVLVDGGKVSSRGIRTFIEAGDMRATTRMLGRPFTIDFEVVYGRQLGRQLGWPTINQQFPAGFVIPRYGVYATTALLDGKIYSSVTNVGVKPTVGSRVILAETHIQGFSDELYGRRVRVQFLEFLRPEEKFGSLEQLTAAIKADAALAERITVGGGFLRAAEPTEI